MDCWVIRAGRSGQHADVFEKHGWAAVELEGLPDVGGWSREEMVARVPALLGINRAKAHGYAVMLYRFAHEMSVGDLVVTPDTERGEVLAGLVAGDYEFVERPLIPGHQHIRHVDWRGRMSRRELPEQVRRAIGAPMAVFKPGAQDAVRESLATFVNH